MLTFAGAVLLHGVWNGLAIGAAVSGLAVVSLEHRPLWAAALGLVTASMLVALFALMTATLTSLLWAGRALARQERGG